MCTLMYSGDWFDSALNERVLSAFLIRTRPRVHKGFQNHDQDQAQDKNSSTTFFKSYNIY